MVSICQQPPQRRRRWRMRQPPPQLNWEIRPVDKKKANKQTTLLSHSPILFLLEGCRCWSRFIDENDVNLAERWRNLKGRHRKVGQKNGKNGPGWEEEEAGDGRDRVHTVWDHWFDNLEVKVPVTKTTPPTPSSSFLSFTRAGTASTTTTNVGRV